MKLENCGRCGLEPVMREWECAFDAGPAQQAATCPTGHAQELTNNWNAAQFAARTERINAAAVALAAGDWASDSGDTSPDQVVVAAVRYINAMDAAARVRWAEMQGGE